MAKPLFPWMGNKEKLAPYIQKMIPPGLTQFAEVFGGSGAMVLALKPKRGRLDIYNDLNSDLFNVFCCIKERPAALCKELKFFPIHGREAFAFFRDILSHEPDYFRHIQEEKDVIRQEACFSEQEVAELLAALDGRAELFDVQRAAAFLLTQHGSFSGTGNSVGVKTVDVGAIVSRFPAVSKRIETVFLENQDAMELIPKRDTPTGLIYADPPYVDAERCYDVCFPRENHIHLRDRLTSCRGKVILSYNNCPFVWDLYRDRFYIFSLIRENPLAQAKAATYRELILTNYDPRPYMEDQLDLFAPSDGQKWIPILLHAPSNFT
jgi:DNA adenine methylase